jgi:Uncharacterized protein conserved in bacteria (DUF2191).
MATNLAIDDVLLETALEIGGYKSKKDTVNAALEEFIKRRNAKELIKSKTSTKGGGLGYVDRSKRLNMLATLRVAVSYS